MAFELMGEDMGLKDFYYKLEDKYYGLLDWLDAKGIKFYAIDDWLQKNNIPSFPVVTITFLLIVALLVYFTLWGFGVVGVNNINATIQFHDKTTDSLARDLQVVLVANGNKITKTADASGEVSFRTQPNKEVEISLTDPSKYKLEQTTIVFEEDGQKKTVNLLDIRGAFLSRTFKLFEDVTSNALFMGDVDLDISCNAGADYQKTVSATGGQFDLSDVPADCESLLVSAPGLGVTEIINMSDEAPKINLGSAQLKKGFITVNCIDTDGAALANIAVSAINEVGVKEADAVTQTGGSVKLEVPVGKYYLILNDLTQTYSPLDSRENQSSNYFYDDVTENAEKIVTLSLTKGNLGFITIKVTNPAGKEVSGGVVTIYKNDSSWSFEGTLDENGLFRYGVKDLTDYRVVVDHPQYMIAQKSGLTVSDMAYGITLSPVTTNPELIVKVLGADKLPIANATVQIFEKATEELPVLTKTTGADGTADFRRLAAGKTYFAKVSKGEYSARSADMLLDARRTNEVVVTLSIGDGDVSVLVLDEAGSPVSGAEVEFYNLETDSIIGVAQTTDATGYATTRARGDNVVYAKISKQGFGDFFTISVPVQVSVTTELTGYLVGKPVSLGMKFLGLYNELGTAIQGTPARVATASNYKARFLLEVPEGVAYNDGEVFFRMDTVKELSQASLFITNINTLGAVVEKGTTYNAPNGYADDMTNRTAGNGLWAIAKLSKVKNGTQMVEINFSTVSKPAKSTLSLSYRAALRNGNAYSRTPQDDELAAALSTGSKHGFYANLESVNILIGNAVCSNVFCAEFEITDESGNAVNVFNSYSASKNGKYKLKLVNMFSVTNRQFNDAKLEIFTETGSIEYAGMFFKVNEKLVNVLGSNKRIIVPISSVNKTLVITGSFDMSPVKEGLLPLMFRVVDKDGTVLFEHKIEVNVDPAKEMMITLVPNVIVPYVNNAIMVSISDSKGEVPVENAAINVYSNDISVASGKTTFDGTFAFELLEPNKGDTIKVSASAAGYNAGTLLTIVSENILISEPAELSITVDRSAQDFVSNKFILKNVTPLSLKLANIKLAEGEYSKYLNVDINRTYVNRIIDNNIEVPYKAELTKLGGSILSPKGFKTILFIDVESKEVGKTWTAEIPVNIYIKLKGSLDSKDCLTLEPATDSDEKKWSVVLTNAGESATQGFIVKNNCTYKEAPAVLYNAELAVLWSGKELGKFSAEDKQLSKKAVMLFDELNSGETPISIKFEGDKTTIAGTAKTTLTLSATHPTETGVQKVESKSEVNVIVSDIARCIDVIGPNGNLNGLSANNIPVVVIGVNSNGLGYTQFANMMGQNPFGMMPNMGLGTQQVPVGGGYPTNYGENYNYFFGQGSGLMNRGGVNDPTMATYANPALFNTNPNQFYAQNMMQPNMYGNQNMAFSMMPGQATQIPVSAAIELKNKCPYPVKLNIRSTPQVLIGGPTDVELAQGASKQVTVTSTQYPGAYQVSLLGSYNGLDLFPILNIPINVVDMSLEGISEDCFKLSENPINFSGFVDMIKKVTVINTCYLKGVTFDTPPVALQNLIVQSSELNRNLNGGQVAPNQQWQQQQQLMPGQQPWQQQGLLPGQQAWQQQQQQQPQPYSNADLTMAGGSAPYVTATAYEPSVKPHASYGKIQETDVFLKKSLAIQRPDRVGPTSNNMGGLVSRLSNTRVQSGQQFMSVQLPAMFMINALFGRGYGAQKKVMPIQVTIIDNFNYLGFTDVLEDFLQSGNPNCNPQSWRTHILKSNATERLNYNDFGNSSARVPKIGKYKLLDTQSCFGSFDSIQFADEYIECANGYFKVYPNVAGAEVSFDVVAAKEVPANNTSGYRCNAEFEYVIKSYHFPDAPDNYTRQRFTLNLTIKLETGLIAAANISGQAGAGASRVGGTSSLDTMSQAERTDLANLNAKGQICKTILKDGSANVLSLYLRQNPKISFIYEGVKCSPFDENGVYCDAHQFFKSIEGSLATSFTDLPSTNSGNFVYSADANYLVLDNKLIELKPEWVFMHDDYVKIQQKIRTDLNATSHVLNVSGYREIIDLMETTLNTYDTFGSKLNLFFWKTKDGNCPELSVERTNKCYLNAETVTEEQLTLFLGLTDGFTGAESRALVDADITRLIPDNSVYLMTDFNIETEGTLMQRYYIAKALNNGNAEKAGFFIANLKKDNYKDAYTDFKRTIGTRIVANMPSDLVIPSLGTYLVDFQTGDKYQFTQFEIPNANDFIYKLVLDPYEQQTPKKYGYCISAYNSMGTAGYKKGVNNSGKYIVNKEDISTTLNEHPDNTCDKSLFTAIGQGGGVGRGDNSGDDSIVFTISSSKISYPELDRVVSAYGRIDLAELETDAGAAWDKECVKYEVNAGIPATRKVYALYCADGATIEPLSGSIYVNNTQQTGKYTVTSEDQQSYGLHDVFSRPNNYCIRVTPNEMKLVYLPEMYSG